MSTNTVKIEVSYKKIALIVLSIILLIITIVYMVYDFGDDDDPDDTSTKDIQTALRIVGAILLLIILGGTAYTIANTTKTITVVQLAEPTETIDSSYV